MAQRLTLTSGSTVLRQRLGQLSESDIQAAREAFSKWRQKPEGPPQEQVKTPYPAACAAVWRDLIDQAPENPRQRIEEALRFLATTSDPGVLPGKEIALLGLLGNYLDWDTAGQFVRRAILTQDIAERAALPEDVRAHYWVRQQADAAEAEVRLALDELFVGDGPRLASAERRWIELVGEGKGGQYNDIGA